MKSLNEVEELKRVQGSTFDEFSRRRLIENRDTVNELTARIQGLKNEVNSMNDSRDFQDTGQPHVPSQPALLPPYRDPGGMSSRSLGTPSRNDRPPSIWDTHGKYGNVFANPPASSSSPCPGGFNPWISNVTEDTSPHATSERQNPDNFESEMPVRTVSSVVISEGRFSKDFRADQQRLQISDLHFDKFPKPATFACWKIRFKTEECTCSQFSTEPVLWIKEVEMVESVDDLKSSRSIRRTLGPDSELLDTRIASALNKIIQNTRFKKKVSLEEMKAQKEHRFLRGKTDSILDLRMLLGHWSQRFCRKIMPTYLQFSSK